jgi:hypothetical protein
VTPPGFRLIVDADQSWIDRTGHVIRVAALISDERRSQLVGRVERRFCLDDLYVLHERLELVRKYRGICLAPLLLAHSFRCYDELEMTSVYAHAALETGRWYWARLGFEPSYDDERRLIETWGRLACCALGSVLPRDLLQPEPLTARGWALLGKAEDLRVSLAELQAAMAGLFSARLADPSRSTGFSALERELSDRLGGPPISQTRFEQVAAKNFVTFNEPIDLGRAVMLAGIDWLGEFDLIAGARRRAFQAELESCLRRLAQRERAS